MVVGAETEEDESEGPAEEDEEEEDDVEDGGGGGGETVPLIEAGKEASWGRGEDEDEEASMRWLEGEEDVTVAGTG
jgi:hypothetical protein